MLTHVESILLSAPPQQFPLLAAVTAKTPGCSSCSHKNVGVHQKLKLALLQYRRNKDFIAWCKTKIHIPQTVCGVYLEDIK